MNLTWLLLALPLIIATLLNQAASVHGQQVCDAYVDFFTNLNKYDPAFDNLAYTTPPIRVDMMSKLNLITFIITDQDNFPNTKFEFSSNDTNFFIDEVIDPNNPNLNQFSFNFKG